MLDTRLSDAERYPLKLRDLIIMGLSPTRRPGETYLGRGNDQHHQ